MTVTDSTRILLQIRGATRDLQQSIAQAARLRGVTQAEYLRRVVVLHEFVRHLCDEDVDTIDADSFRATVRGIGLTSETA